VVHPVSSSDLNLSVPKTWSTTLTWGFAWVAEVREDRLGGLLHEYARSHEMTE
jgi:hypothetical protein